MQHLEIWLPLTTWLCLASQALPQSAEGSSPALDSGALARIESRARRLLEPLVRAGLPGISAALVLPSGETLTVALGESDPAEQRPMSAADRMLSGSVGKTYVIGVLQHLLATDALSLSSEARSFFEGEALALVESLPGAGRCTLAQLLRHQSGLPRYVFDPEFCQAMAGEPDRVWRPAELLSYVVGQEPLFAAGEGWAYSDTNYILVGMILERVTGEAFYALARRLLLEPLDLRDTIPTDTRRIEHMAQGRVVSARSMGVPEHTLEAGEFVFNVQFEWCGGGFASTPLDLARWVGVLYGGELLDEPYLDAMLETVPADALGPGTRYGLGVMLLDSELGPLRFHDGFMPGYLTSAGHFPDVGLSVAFQTNTDEARLLGRRPARLLEELAQIAAEELGL